MFWIVLAFSAILGTAHAQTTAESNVAPELRECYTDPLLLDRNNLPPVTVQVLIDIIQKIEDSPNVNVDLRVLSVLLLHKFRQDGIEYHQPEINLGEASSVLPYAPTFHSFYRHRLLLTKLIPSSLQTIDNGTISSALKCALHHMLSTTVDSRVRGDENNCGQLSQLRALRTARSIGEEDVEVFTPTRINTQRTKSERQLLGGSTCPILTGVISTRWGAVSAGNLIAGIAAGAQLQQVTLTELTRGLSSGVISTQQQSVSNIYPATLSGDIAEAVLIQGTRGVSSITIGGTGNWNSTQAQKFFMLSSRQNVEMTDPEIRGDLDGFILGNRMNNILQTFGTLKLSQLLDMYYTPRNGVFDTTVRACNRRAISQAIINDNNLVGQSEAFAVGLNAHIPLQGTLFRGVDQLVTNAVTNFQSYTQSNLNDLNCDVSESFINYRLGTNLYIVLDASWQYQTIYPAISYLLDSIEVNKFGSSITLLSAFDGSVVINKTFSLADFHTNYTLARHQSMMTGVNLETAYTNIRVLMESTLLEETRLDYVGGNSTVLLFLLNSGTLQINDQVRDQARIINETIPDLRVLYATSTNQYDSLWNLVRDMHNDVHVTSLTSTGTNVANILAPLLDSIRQVNRRIINPLCGYQYTAESSGTKSFDDYIEPGYINFYSVNPNYFYQNNDNRKIRIVRTSSGSGTLTICHSRSVTQPRRNSTIVGLDENMITCQDLTASGDVEISLQNACDGYSTIGSCPLLYISVQSVSTVISSPVCTSTRLCRFPYNIVYRVQIEELACFNNGLAIVPSLVFVVVALVFNMFRSFQ
ncbi:uncharacterized protein ACR2FA_011171 isoform 2-T2 [Aphomia sociella]